jgi:hypothetical protein
MLVMLAATLAGCSHLAPPSPSSKGPIDSEPYLAADQQSNSSAERGFGSRLVGEALKLAFCGD